MPISSLDIEPKKINKPSRRKKIFKVVAGFIFLLFLGLGLLSYYAYQKIGAISTNVEDVSVKIESIQAAVEDQDVTKTKTELVRLRDSLQNTKQELETLKYLNYIPYVKNYYSDSQHAINAAILGTQAGEMIADSVSPFSDILGLKGSKTDQNAEEKVKILVTQVFPSLSKKVDELEDIYRDIKTEVDEIDPNNYPEDLVINDIHIRETLDQTKASLNAAEPYIPQLKNAFETLPSILGYKKEKTYLIWFQNDKELRPTGGFITAYGVAKIKDGKLLDVTSDDIYELDKRFAKYEPAPKPLRKYLNLTVFPIRDANLSPDFKESAEKFESFFKKIPNQPEVDGIITIDTEVVRRFLEITGPITVGNYNETFSAENNPDYGIPDVVYKLELYAEKILRGKNDRKGLIGDLMDEMLGKLFKAKPEEFSKIFDTFIKATDEKHILFYFHDKKAQELVEDLNYAGRIKDFKGDYLHVSNSNFGGLKGNLYIKASIEQDIKIDEGGSVTKKVVVTLRNTKEADWWLNAVYRNWMRLYVPKDSKLIDREVFADFAESEDLNKRVWESFSLTQPLNQSVTSFTYRLPFKVKKGETYKLLMQKQPGIDVHMTIRLNGKKMEEFDLKEDKEIEFQM